VKRLTDALWEIELMLCGIIPGAFVLWFLLWAGGVL